MLFALLQAVVDKHLSLTGLSSTMYTIMMPAPPACTGTVVVQEVDVQTTLSCFTNTSFNAAVQSQFEALLLSSIGPVLTRVGN